MENRIDQNELDQNSIRQRISSLSSLPQSSPQTPKNSPAENEIVFPSQHTNPNFPPTQNFLEDAASIASDITFRNRPLSLQNQHELYNPYNSPYGTPMAYHKSPIISATVARTRGNFRSNLPRTKSTDDLHSNNRNLYDRNTLKNKSPKKEKNNMVLQVVLPSPSLSRTQSEGNFFRYPENDTSIRRICYESESMTPQLRDQQSFNELYPQKSDAVMVNDMYIPSNYDYDNQKLPRSPANSEATTHVTSSHKQKLPSSPEEKRKLFSSSLSMTLGIAYGLLIICLGVSFYVIDMFNLEDRAVNFLAEGFSLYLLVTALLYFLYLILDVSIYIRKRRIYEKLLEQNTPEKIEMKENYNGSMELNITLPKMVSLKNKLDHRYCFNKDRHSNNFFLKLGAAGFCSGHLIHSLLILTYRGMSIGSTNSACFNVVTFLIEILYPLYSVVVLFFIFKYSNIIINKNASLHRLGFMHCIASSLCFWVWTIFRETAEYLAYQKKKENEIVDYNESINITDLKNPLSARVITEILPMRFTKMCEHDELTYIYQNMSPYLYPFSVEFSILAVGVLVIVWQNIGLCKKDPDHNLDHNQEDHDDLSSAQLRRKSSVPESSVAIHADCHASNKGLFSGFVVLVFAIVATIIFFVSYNNNLGNEGYLMNRITHTVILGLMIIAAVAAYIHIVKLDVNFDAHNMLDNILLVICLPAYFVNTIFSIIPGIIFGRPLPVIGLVFEVIQILIQTPFMIDGMARSSNSKDLRKKKPGRQWVTFLVITNVAMWIMETFEVKSHGFEQYRQEYYSKELWSIVGHICLPLMMFYRFHSAACLGDVWKFAYIRSGH